jgi:hypothetical protein
MKKHTIIIAIVICLLNIASAYSQTSSKVTVKDFQRLIGDWKGTLTYLDYSSNKPYTMPADISISQSGKSKIFFFSNIYPNEPKANSTDTIKISKNGRMINNETVKSKRKLKNGNTKITMEYSGLDGNDKKPAIIRITYNFGKTTFTKTKEVQFEGQEEWIKRHEYSYTRK